MEIYDPDEDLTAVSGTWSEWTGSEFQTNSGISVTCAGAVNYVMTDSTIRTAVAAWLSDSASAEATYGHISTWDTSGVTDLSQLLCGASWYSSRCNAAARSFNEDIGAWDTSSVTDAEGMFYGAMAFNQDLGWCVDDGVNLDNAFSGTPCESTYCGVMWETNTGDCGVSPTGNVIGPRRARPPKNPGHAERPA